MEFYSYSNRPPRREFFNNEPSMTIQDAAGDTDINNLVARYNATGSFHSSLDVPHSPPSFEDLADAPTYHEAMNALIEVQETFASLPSQLRDRFANDPANLLEFLADAGNRDEAVKLGLVNAPKETLKEAQPASLKPETPT